MFKRSDFGLQETAAWATTRGPLAASLLVSCALQPGADQGSGNPDPGFAGFSDKNR